uniref:Minor capsid protein P11 C-terminal conserved region domain-containing protein n=1 Tax=Florenciella sp. virus SA2 TaxID=3240092 RepID=A0AB39JEX2_9VIRU
METSKTDKMSCNNQPVMDPKELLPLDSNKEWNNIKPNGDLKQLNLVNAGHHIGINTVSSSLRNPNLQIRSEPSIPKGNVGPWNNTTIEGDPHRKGFELA